MAFQYKKEDCDRTMGRSFKIRLGIRKKLSMQRVVRRWNMLLREVVDVPSLEVLKARLAGF